MPLVVDQWSDDDDAYASLRDNPGIPAEDFPKGMRPMGSGVEEIPSNGYILVKLPGDDVERKVETVDIMKTPDYI